jgi:CBS domain-containing membrane protein
MLQFPRIFSIEPVRLSLKEKAIVTLACFIAIAVTSYISHRYANLHTATLIASMGASAVILFVMPSSPLAQPWQFVGGQLTSALSGIFCAFYVPDQTLSAALAVSLAVMIMLLLRCLHPPGAATALSPVLSDLEKPTLDLGFLLQPVGINILMMLVMAYTINRFVLRRNYPTTSQTPVQSDDNPSNRLNKLVDINEQDVKQAVLDFDQYLDIGTDVLLQIFTRLQLQTFEKHTANLTCADIMQCNIVTVEYATEVEAAWTLMYDQQLKVLPVLDVTHRVIGIVTRYDFLKNLKLTPYLSFQEKWLAFIQRSTSTHTRKPEAIGHIMTRKVKTLSSNAHIAELLPLITNEGHHHVPIVDDENRFVGVVFQSQLLAALFRQQTNSQSRPWPAGFSD